MHAIGEVFSPGPENVHLDPLDFHDANANMTGGDIPRAAMINDRYEVQRSLGKHGFLEMLLAFDHKTKQEVVLEMLGTKDERAQLSWRQEAETLVSLMQKIQHPNVCRIHGLEFCGFSPMVVTEYVAGQSLHIFIRKSVASMGMTVDEFRSIGTNLFSGLAAMHAHKVLHGDIKPGKMRIATDRAVIHSFWHTRHAYLASMRDPGLAPDNGTPNYMSPERLRDGDASFEDDVYSMALTLWEAFSCRVPEPGYNPRGKPMKQQIMLDKLAAELPATELRQLFQALHEDPNMRPKAKQMRFGVGVRGELPVCDGEDQRFAEWIR